MNKFFVIALDTYKKHIYSISFLVMILAPILFLGIFYGINNFGSKLQPLNDIAVVSFDQKIKNEVIERNKEIFNIDADISNESEAQDHLISGEIDGYLLINTVDDKINASYIGTKVLGMSELQQLHLNLNQIQLKSKIDVLNLDTKEVESLFSTAVLNEQKVNINNNKIVIIEDNKETLLMIGTITIFIVYFIVLLYGNITAQEVASEKGTRIMEVILSSTTASKHFYGKISGIFLVILTQVGIYLLIMLLSFYSFKNTQLIKALMSYIPTNDRIINIVGYNLLYLLLGVLIYIILAAFLGSLVSKVEESSKAGIPVMYLTMIGFISSVTIGMSNPNSVIIKVFSYLPFLSSFSMPIRIANQTVTSFEIIISLSILILSTILLLKLSAKTYKSTVLIYSDKGIFSTLKTAIKLSK